MIVVAHSDHGFPPGSSHISDPFTPKSWVDEKHQYKLKNLFFDVVK